MKECKGCKVKDACSVELCPAKLDSDNGVQVFVNGEALCDGHIFGDYKEWATVETKKKKAGA